MAGNKDKKNDKSDTSSKKPVEETSAIKLEPKLGINNVTELVDSLMQSFERPDPIQIDMGDVEQVDTATLQVLVGFVNDALKTERKVEWIGHSEALEKYAKTIAVNQYLEFESEDDEEDNLCPVF